MFNLYMMGESSLEEVQRGQSGGLLIVEI